VQGEWHISMDSYRIDSHKLMYHIDRVSQWLNGQDIYPVYMEVSPTGACNHRCVFCGLDFMEYKPRQLATDLLMERLTEMGRLGLKSVMFAGEGEPFIHKGMAQIAEHAQKNAGIDVAFTTNAVLMTPVILECILPVTSWIKVSINAGTPETYAAIHRTDPDDFNTVCKNLEQAVQIRQRQKGNCTLGAQVLLLPENQAEIVTLANICRDIGLDYLVVKPYSQHPQGRQKTYENISYSQYDDLAAQLSSFRSASFEVVFRYNAMQKWDDGSRSYQRCQAIPFWAYLDAGGNVWGCSIYLGDDRFCYGNIKDSTFKEIWEGQKRKTSMEWVNNRLDVSACRIGCRMDEVNRYLWELKNPHPHVNFI